uniref:Uncharacterized protein n=1 Tax=Nelumbo nucifera TaxID=4432 RepID=A0A822Z006_NELNU|nr:TPA_asm: hypothetical protein HUJ06_014007 [Nelumbo nucifera]
MSEVFSFISSLCSGSNYLAELKREMAKKIVYVLLKRNAEEGNSE